MQDRIIEKRITRIRLIVWTTASLLTFCCFRSPWPLAWQTAAFGALFTLLWPLVGGRGGEKEKRRKGEEETEEIQDTSYEVREEQDSSLIPHPSSLLNTGLDLMVTTILIGVSGGVGSPFAPLLFVVVLEAFALCGRRTAIHVACAAATLNLVQFRSGFTPASAILYGLAMGTLLAAMLTVKMAQARETEDNPSRNTGLMRPPDIAELLAQLDAAQKAHESIKDKYRAVITLNRDQKAQMARTQIIEQLCELGGASLADDASGRLALARVLLLVMKLTGADGGVLWLRGRDGNTLTAQVAEGKIAEAAGQDALLNLNALTPDAVRAHCEAGLLNAATPALPPRSRLDALFGTTAEDAQAEENDEAATYAIVPQQANFQDSPHELRSLESIKTGGSPSPRLFWKKGLGIGEDAGGYYQDSNSAEAMFETFTATGDMLAGESEFDLLLAPPALPFRPTSTRHSAKTPNPGLVGVTLLRTRPTSEEPTGKIMGAVGVCDPRGRERFLNSELEKVSSLCRVLTSAISSICERANAHRQVREVTLLQELQRMTRAVSNTDQESRSVEQTAAHVMELAMELAACENGALFLLDARGQRLEAKATRGQAINLLDHIRFERGHGVSGWVASCGRLLHIPDVTQEPNLLNLDTNLDLAMETLPLPARSFLALPLRVDNAIVGVLNISHAHPHAFTPHTIRLLTELAKHAAVLLSHAAPLQMA